MVVNDKLEYQRAYRKTKRGHLTTFLSNLKSRAKAQNVPCDVTLNDLEEIAEDVCPIFKTPFVWSQNGGSTDNTPSLDKVIPELGYVKHNIVFISLRANRIKQDVTEKELYAVADWLHEKRKEVLNAVKEQPTHVPTGADREGESSPQHGTIPTSGTGEDDDYPHHHCGTVRGEDVNHRAQEGSGDSVGHGGKEMATPETLTRLEDHGQPDAEIVRLDFGRRYLSD